MTDEQKPKLVTVTISTRHHEDYLLTNMRDGTRWRISPGGRWVRVLAGELHR